MTLLDWLRLGRPHTASLTIPVALLGVAAAGGGPWWLWLGVGAWALWFHYIGFAHNGLADLEHDRLDPSKAHFPLVSGAISVESALRTVTWGTAVGLVAAWLIAGWWNIPAAFWAVWATSWGVAYNLTSKRSLFAPLFISAAFSSIPMYGYYAAGGTIFHAYDAGGWYGMVTDTGFLLWAYAFAAMFFQIAVSGYLKELPQRDQPNLLRRTGWAVIDLNARDPDFLALLRRHHFSDPIPVPYLVTGNPWPVIARLPCLILASVIASVLGADTLLLLGMVPPQAAILLVTLLELKDGPFDRPRRVRLMAVNEILAYWLLVVAFAPVLGWAAVAFFALPLLWFAGYNRVLWGPGHWVAPKV